MQLCPSCKTICPDGASVCDCGSALPGSRAAAIPAGQASELRSIAADIRAIRRIAVLWLALTFAAASLLAINWALQYGRQAQSPTRPAIPTNPRP